MPTLCSLKNRHQSLASTLLIVAAWLKWTPARHNMAPFPSCFSFTSHSSQSEGPQLVFWLCSLLPAVAPNGKLMRGNRWSLCQTLLRKHTQLSSRFTSLEYPGQLEDPMLHRGCFLYCELAANLISVCQQSAVAHSIYFSGFLLA